MYYIAAVKLWRKGEESGNVKRSMIYIDCDNDTLLLKSIKLAGLLVMKVIKLFFRKLEGDDYVVVGNVFDPNEVCKK